MKPTSQELADLLRRTLDWIDVDETAGEGPIVLVRQIRAAVDASASVKPKPERKPKIQIGRDTASLDDRGLRAYYKQNDLYYSALFHGRRLNGPQFGPGPRIVDWADLAARILVEGNTPALKREYLRLYEAQQRQHRSWVMPSDGLDTRPEPIRADRTVAEWEAIRHAARKVA